MAHANPVKGELELKTSSASYLLCLSWPAQKRIGKHFAMPFREAMRGLNEVSDDDFTFIVQQALSHHHPDLSEDQVDAVISELGFNAVAAKITESLALAYDMGTSAAGEAGAENP